MDRIGIEFLSVFKLPPVELVHLAADLGCRHISTSLISPPTHNPHGYAPWSLCDDRGLRQQMNAAMRERGVSISLGEGFSLRPGVGAREREADLDLMCELGVTRINSVLIDIERERGFDELARLAEMAHARGVETTLEFGPGMSASDLPTALAALRHVGQAHCKLLIDTMHLLRSGATVADVAALDPACIGYVQLCDVPRDCKHASYAEEAMNERMVPGSGELPLRDVLAALPRDLVIGLEVPQLSLAQAGQSPQERLGPCVEATRRLLREIETA